MSTELNPHNPTVYAVYGLPPAYTNLQWEDLDVTPEEVTRLSTAFSTPINSTVFIQGIAAPIIRQLIEQKAKVRGIDFSKRQLNAFEEHNNPDAEVILIWNVNKYSGKTEVSMNLLENLVTYYRSKGALVLVQSNESSIFMRDNYGFTTANKVKLIKKQDPKWLG